MGGNSEVKLLELKKVQYVYSMKCERKYVSIDIGSVLEDRSSLDL